MRESEPGVLVRQPLAVKVAGLEGGVLGEAGALGPLLALKRAVPAVLAVGEVVLAAEEAAPLAVLQRVAPALLARALLLRVREGCPVGVETAVVASALLEPHEEAKEVRVKEVDRDKWPDWVTVAVGEAPVLLEPVLEVEPHTLLLLQAD